MSSTETKKETETNSRKHGVPEDVLRGFAEYGANFFALYTYTKRVESQPIYCITEKPFSFKVSTEWSDTPKTSLAKKLSTINGTFGSIAQTITGKDYDLCLAGNSTYVRYSGVDRLKYDAQVTVLNQNYTNSSKAFQRLSTATEIEEFLMKNGLPKVNEQSFGQLAQNVLQVPMDAVEKVVDISDKIQQNVSQLDETTALALLSAMNKASKAIKEFVSKEISNIDTALRKDNDSDVLSYSRLLSTGNLMPKYSRIDFAITCHDDGNSIEIKISETGGGGETIGRGKTFLTINHLGDEIEDLMEKINENNTEATRKQILDFYVNKWKPLDKFFEISKDGSWTDIISNFIKDASYKSERKLKFASLSSKIAELREEIIKKRKDNGEDNINGRILKETGKLKESKSTINDILNNMLNLGDASSYGNFEHRIVPCILYYSIAGKIIRDHVLVSSWSASENIWGFSTVFNISLEKAEVDTWETFSERML